MRDRNQTESGKSAGQPLPTGRASLIGSVSEPAEALLTITDLRRRIFDLYTVFDIGRRFQAVLDTEALLEGLLLTAIGQLEVGAAAVAIVGTGDPRHLSRTKEKGWSHASGLEWKLAVDSPLARRLVACGGPIGIDEASGDLPPGSPEQAWLRQAGCRLLAPLITRGNLRGVVYIAGKLNGGRFTEGDLEFLSLLLEQASISLDNALLSEAEREATAQLLETRERLARAEKLSALGNLAGTVAHEVNNPLGIIKNYIELLRPVLADSPEGVEKLEMIGREVERMIRFVRGLFGAFHPERKSGRAVEIRPLIEDALQFASPELAARRIRLALAFPDTLPPVWGESESLREVFLNLALNARDAMPEGGQLTVTAAATDEWVEIRFADEGGGIDPAVANEIFEPFVTTKTDADGTGLGLSICQSIVQGFGGTIVAENLTAPQRGAVFRVRLRCDRPDRAAASTGTPPITEEDER